MEVIVHNKVAHFYSSLCMFLTTPLSSDAPSPGNTHEYLHTLYIARKYHWPTFLPLIVWVYLHSKFCGGLRKTHGTHFFCNRVCMGSSRSSKVVDFSTNWKGVWDFLL